MRIPLSRNRTTRRNSNLEQGQRWRPHKSSSSSSSSPAPRPSPSSATSSPASPTTLAASARTPAARSSPPAQVRRPSLFHLVRTQTYLGLARGGTADAARRDVRTIPAARGRESCDRGGRAAGARRGRPCRGARPRGAEQPGPWRARTRTRLGGDARRVRRGRGRAERGGNGGCA